jgi:hypothetical protein
MYANVRSGGDVSKIRGGPVRDRSNWRAHDPASLAPNLRGTRVHVHRATAARASTTRRAWRPGTSGS